MEHGIAGGVRGEGGERGEVKERDGFGCVNGKKKETPKPFAFKGCCIITLYLSLRKNRLPLL